MKKSLLIAIMLISAASCKETEYSPEGPTDVRIKNSTGLTMSDITVNTSGGINNFGSIGNNQLSGYLRFEKAYPDAEVTAVINGQSFSTGVVDYNGMTYIGQAKITYDVIISDLNNRKLSVDVTLDAPLK
jgi:hypothetical protein